MIPKIIHYIWFGGNKKSSIIEKCIKSWKMFCPDYEIMEWDENNFDVKCCRYVEEAYAEGKWAFVSDYVRHKVLNEYGGIYLDTDVEIIKPLDDLLPLDMFCGFESIDSVNTGLICGCVSDNWYCKKMLSEYESESFYNSNGYPNLYTVCQRTTKLLQSYGLDAAKNETQNINGMTIFASDFFNPMNMSTGKIELTANTYSIHRYAASWVDRKSKLRGKIYKVIARLFGVNTAVKIRKLIGKNK